MKDQFDEFAQEVENDIRQEKLKDLWAKYGKMASTVVGGALAIGVGITLWQNHQSSVSLHLSDTLLSVQEHLAQGKSQEALTLLDQIAIKHNKVYSPLALFEKAALLCESADDLSRKEGMDLYAQLKTDSKISPLYKELAALIWISNSLEESSSDFTALLNEVEQFTKKESYWRYTALELKGLLLEKTGNLTGAREVFFELARDEKTPQGISMRAQLMGQLLQPAKS